MEVCIALGLLISELAEQPWVGRAITFISRLEQKLSFVRCLTASILLTAVDAHLAPEKMIRTLFVFSDMEFSDAGYGDVVLQIVSWNLRNSRSTSVTSTQPGVAMENVGVVSPDPGGCHGGSDCWRRVPEACRV
ncbi:hypothetical protein C2845_PM11G04160 [Panicum miliaceum]|uniref:DUF7788 domain-containing protein n=1 Tax=Panicum miliaceum TaxID=4540 RepID=A0A3L6RT98_PANMI|nr:hypothetical protein C2845_PM11G04160 [Panicum miliaceum]